MFRRTRMQRWQGICLSFLFLLTFTLSCGEPEEKVSLVLPVSVREKITDVVYPMSLKPYGSQSEHMLLGTGVRKKFGIVNVYAIGLYVDPIPASRHLIKWKGKNTTSLVQDESFYEFLLNRPFGKVLRFVMVRDVDAETMKDAFVEQLDPRLETEQAKKDFEIFKSSFIEDLKISDQLTFVWLPEGDLHILFNDVLKKTIKNNEFSTALFDVYLGQDAISQSAKESFASGLPTLFAKASHSE